MQLHNSLSNQRLSLSHTFIIIHSSVCLCVLAVGFVYQVEGAVLRGAGRTPRAAGTWKWETVCPGQSHTLSVARLTAQSLLLVSSFLDSLAS